MNGPVQKESISLSYLLLSLLLLLVILSGLRTRNSLAIP